MAPLGRMQGRFFAGRRALSGAAALFALPLTATAVGAPHRGRATGGFDSFLDGVRADGRKAGISPGTLNRALAGLRPNPRVLELDRYQPEGPGMTWEEYREKIVSPTRVENGRRAFAESRRLLDDVAGRFRVSPRVVVAIWGMETNYGTNTGGFGVIEALATLAWDGRRSAYFRSELLAALRVLDGGHIPPERMRGSWAGAMGQPQFMPSNFERLAVDFDGDGRRDIWDSRADALGSIAHYLSRHGWREGEPWGMEVLSPGPVETYDTDSKRPLRDWARLGFRRADGGPLPGGEAEMGLVQPNRSAGKVFLGGHNLRVIRRYNPPVNYGLAVGLLSDRVA
jgi:membrane-bound lytic murein transglycosylase B